MKKRKAVDSKPVKPSKRPRASGAGVAADTPEGQAIAFGAEAIAAASQDQAIAPGAGAVAEPSQGQVVVSDASLAAISPQGQAIALGADVAAVPQDQSVVSGAGAGSNAAPSGIDYRALSLGGEGSASDKNVDKAASLKEKIIQIAIDNFCKWSETEPASQEAKNFIKMLTACLDSDELSNSLESILDSLEKEEEDKSKDNETIPTIFNIASDVGNIELLEFLWRMANCYDKKAALLQYDEYSVLANAKDNYLITRCLIPFAKEINLADELFASSTCRSIFMNSVRGKPLSRTITLLRLASDSQGIAIFMHNNCELLHHFVKLNITVFMKEFFALLTAEQNVQLLLNQAKGLISHINLNASKDAVAEHNVRLLLNQLAKDLNVSKVAVLAPLLYVGDIQAILTQFIGKSLSLLTPEQSANFQATTANEIFKIAIKKGYDEIVRALITRFPVLLDDANIFGSVCRYGNVKVFEVIHAARPSLYLNCPASAFFTALRQGNFFLTEHILTLNPGLINIKPLARQPNWLDYLLSSPALINDINSLITQSRDDNSRTRKKALHDLVIIRRAIIYLYAYGLIPTNAMFHHSIQALFTKDGMHYDIRNTVEYAQTYLSLNLALAKDTGMAAFVARDSLHDENLFSEIIPLLIPVPYLSFIEEIFADKQYSAIIQDVFCRLMIFREQLQGIMAIEPGKAVSLCQEAATYLGFRDISTIIAQDGVTRYAKTLPADASKKPLQATTRQVEKVVFACLIEAFKAKTIFADSTIPGKEMAAVIVQTMSKHSQDHKAGKIYDLSNAIKDNLNALLKAKQLAHMSLGEQAQAAEAGAGGASSGSWTERVHVGARAFIFR